MVIRGPIIFCGTYEELSGGSGQPGHHRRRRHHKRWGLFAALMRSRNAVAAVFGSGARGGCSFGIQRRPLAFLVLNPFNGGCPMARKLPRLRKKRCEWKRTTKFTMQSLPQVAQAPQHPLLPLCRHRRERMRFPPSSTIRLIGESWWAAQTFGNATNVV